MILDFLYFLIEALGFMVLWYSTLILTAVAFSVAQHATVSQNLKLGCAEKQIFIEESKCFVQPEASAKLIFP